MTTKSRFGLPLGSHSAVNPPIVIHTSPGPDDSARPDQVKSETSFKNGGAFRVLGLGEDDDQSTTSGYHSKADETSMAAREAGIGPLITAWAPEAVWSLLSVGLLAALVILLNEYNGEPLPDWPAGLTLNAAVALIATVLRAVTVMIVSEGLSQLKWNRFALKDRRLMDLHIFDQASRGPWGSLLMLLKARGGILGIAAAVVFVSGLATSTVTQSAISFPTRLVVSSEGHALLRASYSYGGESARDAPDRTPADRTISESPNTVENVAFQAVYQSADEGWPSTEPSCSSGDCQWWTFNSLALCYDIRNVTEKLKVTSRDGPNLMTEQNATLSLPVQGDFYLADNWKVYWNDGPYNIVNWTSPRPSPWNGPRVGGPSWDDPISFPKFRESVAFSNDSDILRSTVSQWFIIYNNGNADINDDDHKYRAAELVWHFCVNTYNVSVQGGRSRTETIASSSKIRYGKGYGFRLPLDEDPRITSNFSIASADGSDEFPVFDTLDYSRLDSSIRDGLGGGWSTLGLPAGSTYNALSHGVSIRMFAGVGANTTVEDADKLVWGNLESFAATVADGITDFMRNHGEDREGDTLVTETFVRVRWEWLSFVAVQVGLSIVFIISVGQRTASLGVDVVKTSNMAELFAVGPNPEQISSPQGISGMTPEMKKNIFGRLRQREGEWVLELCPAPGRSAAEQGQETRFRRWLRRGGAAA